MNSYSIRPATLADITEILHHRRAMFEDMGVTDSTLLAPMLLAAGKYLDEAMPQGNFRAWFAISEDTQIVGGCAVAISSSPPHPWDPRTRRAYILNLYVYPDHRRNGIARQLLQTTVDWCRTEGFNTVSLHASQHGRSLYESLGFTQTNEMRLKLR